MTPDPEGKPITQSAEIKMGGQVFANAPPDARVTYDGPAVGPLPVFEFSASAADAVAAARMLSPAEMRDFILNAHDMATGNYVQDDTEMRKRIGRLLEKAIANDDVMRGFLGRGGPLAGRDILTGSGALDDPARATARADAVAAMREACIRRLCKWCRDGVPFDPADAMWHVWPEGEAWPCQAWPLRARALPAPGEETG